MAYTTYYISSSGQPANGTETHESLESALEAWQSNCEALLKGSGGRSVMEDDDGEDLVWMEHVEGPYVCGSMAGDFVNVAAEDIDTPAKVAKYIK